MSRVSAPTDEATNGILQESASTQKATSPTVVEHVLSRLKDVGIGRGAYIEIVTDKYAAPPVALKYHGSVQTLYRT